VIFFVIRSQMVQMFANVPCGLLNVAGCFISHLFNCI